MLKRIIIPIAILMVAVVSFASAQEPTVAEKENQRTIKQIQKNFEKIEATPTTVTGQALLPDGSPAIGFKIGGWGRSLTNPGYGHYLFDTITDQQGRFTLHLYRPCQYWIAIDDPNCVYVAPDRHIELKEPLDESPGNTIRFSLQKGVPVAGVIMDKDKNEPIEGLPVYLFCEPISIKKLGSYEKYREIESTRQVHKKRKTDAQGRFRFAALPKENMVSLDWQFGEDPPEDEKFLNLYAKTFTAKEQPIELTFEIPTPWSGHLLQKDGTPAAFYPVGLMYRIFEGTAYEEIITDQQGRFLFYYPISVLNISVDTFEEGQWFYRDLRGKELPPSPVFELYSPVSGSGRLVRKSTGEPMKNFKFLCDPSHEESITTDENGDFEIQGIYLNRETSLGFVNPPDEDSCSISANFKTFTPTQPDQKIEFGTIELEESGRLESGTLENLPGKTLEIEGITLDGQEAFDWKKYQGKVVLVEFWATWCGPCLKEIPHLKTVYEKYRERGFEIVGISVDDDLDALKNGLEKYAFPWINLADQKWADSGKTRMYDRFAVRGVPRGILVDREGKVIAIETRGEKLDAELKKLFPDLPEKVQEPTAAEKQQLRCKEIVKKRNVDDGHLPTEVAGRAVLPDGAPAVGFKIDGWSRSVLHENYGDDFFEATTDENGRFTLPLWRPYLYWLRITDPNNVYVASDQHFELKDVPKSDVVQFQLQKGIPLEGTLKDRTTQAPIADLDVWLVYKPIFSTISEFGIEKYYEYEKNIQTSRKVRTDSEGKFRFAAVPSEYLVTLCNDYGNFRPIPKEDLDYTRLVTIEENPVSVELEIPTPWRARVLQKDGSAAAFYQVLLSATTFSNTYITDKDGYFTVFKTPQLNFIEIDLDSPDVEQMFFKTYDKEILPRDTVFQLASPLSAKGRLVRKSNGEPMKNFKFASRARWYYTDIIKTDEDGFFELNGLLLKNKTDLCFLNEPNDLNTCAFFYTFKSFTPEQTDRITDLGVIELEESGWLEPDFLKNLPGKTIEVEGITLDGQEFDWKKYREKVVLLDFWATWCGPCLQEIPHLKELYEKYRERGFEIVGISLDEDLENLKSGLEKHAFPWTVLSDEKWKTSGKMSMSERFRISEIPQCFLVDRNGKVISIEARGEKLDAELKKLFPDSLEEAETFEQIQSYVEHVFAQSRKNLKTMEDQENFLKTYPPVGIAAGRKIIALGGNDESLEFGYEILLAALHWSLKNHPENVKEIEALAEELKRLDKFPEIVASTRFRLFYRRGRNFDKEEFRETEFDALKDEAKNLLVLEQTGYDEMGPIEIILDIAGAVSQSQNNSQLLDETLEEMIQFGVKAKPENARIEERLRGYCRRMVGAPFELWGKTVDDKDFDWSLYKGKLVLIDFTASWCGPCRAEMPNVVEMYNKYHDQGLEVICVGYLDTTENLKEMMKADKITFPLISEELSKDDFRNRPSFHYGITGIPEIFLVGRDGKILATGLRGPRLREEIKKQFGD